MILTRFKSKLPKTLSYPIGAEALSEALAGVPQFERFDIWFSDQAEWPASKFQRTLRERTPYMLLKAGFERHPPHGSASRAMIAAGYYDETWRIYVYPVVREYRHLARGLLIEHAMPRLKRWLQQPTAMSWKTGVRRMEFTFHPKEAVLTLREVGEVLA